MKYLNGPSHTKTGPSTPCTKDSLSTF
ncbi:hypothetical protein OIU78_007597 [Salix suchowensis]|nr:hypothetical protein OIU78_007597 [Salix suchowensis]